MTGRRVNSPVTVSGPASRVSASSLMVVFLSLWWVSSSLSAQNPVEVPFTIGQGNLIYVEASINDYPARFILDTGASGISISSGLFKQLLQNGRITSQDLIGNIYLMMANGQRVQARMIRIRSFSLGSLQVAQATAVVMPEENAPLLIGQNVLNTTGGMTIDYSRQRLTFTDPGRGQNEPDLTLNELRMIPCRNQLPVFDVLLDEMQKTPPVTVRKISVEQKIPPPPKAVNRLKEGITLRIFSDEDFTHAEEIRRWILTSKLPEKRVSIENMVPYYGGKSQQGYVEIWVK